MNVKLYRQWTIRDKNGKVIKRTRKRLSESYVLAFIDLLYEQFGTVPQSILDTGGDSRSVGAHSETFRANGIAGNPLYGLVVGTGSSAVTLADYALDTLIAEGSGGGQLNYGASSVITPTTSGSTRKTNLTRTFTNNSGSTITVNETGIYVRGGGTSYYFCIARDLESPGEDILNGNSGTLTYTISTTV